MLPLIFVLCFSILLVPTNGGSIRRDFLDLFESSVNKVSGEAEEFMVDFLDGHEWIPAGLIPDAARGGCLMLNTLANHGFLSRDGRNITMANFNDAQTQALNFAPSLAANITTGMMQRLGVLTGDHNHDNNVTLDLQGLTVHNITEHDASLSRLDIIQGNYLIDQPSCVQNMLNDTDPESYPSLNTSALGRTRVRREAESVAAGSPPLVNSPGFFGSALGEAGLVLLFLGKGDEDGQEPDSRSAPKEQVQEWLDYERFPVGWMRSDRELDFDDDLTPLVKRVTYWRSQWLQQES